MTTPTPDQPPEPQAPAGRRGDPSQQGPEASEPRRVTSRFALRALGVAAIIAAVVTAFGAALGWLWTWVAPRVPVRMTADGATLADPQPEQFIAAEAWFVLLGLGLGILASVVAWQLARRWRGPVGLVAVTVGGVGAGLLAWWVGSHIGLVEYHRLLESAPVGATFGKPVDLRASGIIWVLGFIPVVRGDVLVVAFGAAATYVVLAGWSRHASLRPETEPPVPHRLPTDVGEADGGEAT